MAQMADPRDNPRPQYPPPDDPNQTGYYGHQQSPRPSARDERSSYPPLEPSRQGQYPPDPRAGHQYPPPPPPPGQWPGPQHGAYPPTHHYPDPQQAQYSYPPPRPDMGQPPQPMQPDAYRLPPPYPPPGYYPGHYQTPPAPAPRQRTAIACKYCRKRKIRCSGYDSSPDGRCQNCVRFNQQCLFHPVSSQAAFVPASAVYGPNARAPLANPASEPRPGQNGQTYSREGDQPMLYGAHGQPLGPAGPQGQPQFTYPSPTPNYPQSYPYPGHQYPPPPGSNYESQGQASQQHGERVSLKRPLPLDDDHHSNEDSHASQSPRPNTKPRQGAYDSRANSSGSHDYPDPTSPASTTMSYQSYPTLQHRYTNGSQSQKGGNSPPSGLTPQSAHGYNSPHSGPVRDEGRTPPPNQPGSAESSTNGRSGMKVHEMLGNPNNPHPGTPAEQRGKSDNEMLSKLDGKK